MYMRQLGISQTAPATSYEKKCVGVGSARGIDADVDGDGTNASGDRDDAERARAHRFVPKATCLRTGGRQTFVWLIVDGICLLAAINICFQPFSVSLLLHRCGRGRISLFMVFREGVLYRDVEGGP